MPNETTSEAISSREAFRNETVGAFSRYYSPLAHLFFPSAFGVTLVALALGDLGELRWFEPGWVVLFFIFANAVEWRAHKSLLHKRRWWLPVAYERHTPTHHRIFVTEDMAIRSLREVGIVLIPAYGIVLILIVCLPTALLLDYVGLANAARLFIASMMAYVLVYEWLHLAYHAPQDSLVGRNRVVRWLRGQHARHHDPRLMQRYNFNVTFPLWDYVRGTHFRAAAANERARPKKA